MEPQMSSNRRDFLKATAALGLAGPGTIEAAERIPPAVQCPSGKAVHSILERDHPYIYIDSCMQMWPDADFDVAHRHGVTAYAVTAWLPHVDAATALKGLMYWRGIAREHQNLVIVERVDDIRAAKRQGRSGLLLAAQDGDWIGYELHRISAFRDAGLRMLNLAYNATNHLGDGCLDRTRGGLTRLGQRVVEECNRVGIVLDLSHTGKQTTLDIAQLSAKPCVYTHSNPSALVPTTRNIDDEQIRSCTSKGGVVGLVSWGPLVMRPDTTHRPTLNEFIDMIDYVAQLVGDTDHIGIGTDMSIGTYPEHVRDPWGSPEYPSYTAQYNQHVTGDIRSPLRNIEGFSDYAEVVNVAERLLARGYTDSDVQKILGGNFLRVFEEVWT
jgi:membrane dipeptidase